MQHRGLCERTVCPDAAIFAATVCGLDIHTNIFGICGSHDLTRDVVAELFLQGTSATAPLRDAGVFGKTYQFFGSQDTNVSDPNNGLVMMAAHAANFTANHQHTVIAVVAVVGKRCAIGW